jgi:hypothetical protein
MFLNKKKFLKIYNQIKQIAKKGAALNQYQYVIEVYEIIAKLAYHFNVFYADDEIENNLLAIGKEIAKRNKHIAPSSKKKILFFDSFGWDYRGLTQQYIRGLMHNDLELLFVFENFDERQSAKIIEDLVQYHKGSIHILKKNFNSLVKIGELIKVIEDYEPTHAFLHLAPWSISSVIVWNSFTEVTRYQINLTDHAFWLGKNAFDYCIEFRDYGYNISLNFRKIPKEKLIKLPYYPIIDNEAKFMGFPLDSVHKTIIVSGASYYKVFGENDKFFKLLKKVADKNKDIVIYFAGTGNSNIFRQLIQKYKLEGILIPIGNRTDISEVINHADIYLATYPISGGLMAQYAIKSKIPTIGFTHKKLYCNYLESLVDLECNIQLTYFGEETFINELNYMIKDRTYRINKALAYKDAVISVREFDNRLLEIINGKSDRNFKDMEIDTSDLEKIYIEVENKYLKTCINMLYYNRLKLSDIKSTILLLYYMTYPKKLFENIYYKLRNNLFLSKAI